MCTLRRSLVGTVILVLLGGLGGVVLAQSDPSDDPRSSEAESVLFVGNSFTMWNGGVENHVRELAASEDPPRVIVADASTMAGATLKKHYQTAERSPTGGVLGMIREGDYDVVVLQGDIPEIIAQSVEPFLEYARLFDEDIKDAGGRTLFFMTWPYWWVTLDEIVAAHRQVEEELGASVAPVVLAMGDALSERPWLKMFGSDGHESLAGTYLAANVIYATLFEQSPEGLAYRPDEISDDDAAFLQRIAWDAVQDWQAGSPTD